MNGNNIALRLLSALVLVLAIAGIAYFAFQAGVSQGSPITVEAPSGDIVPYPSYGWGPFHHPWGFAFACFGALILVFLFFAAFKAFRLLLWGPHWGWRRGAWRYGWRESGVPPMFEEWHRRAHGEPPVEK